jgi:hypothetical protein
MERADALENGVMLLPAARRAKRWAGVNRWRVLARMLRGKAREAREAVEFRCTACTLKASTTAEMRAVWNGAADTGVLALADGTSYGAPEMAVPLKGGKYGKGDPTVTIERITPAEAEDYIEATDVRVSDATRVRVRLACALNEARSTDALTVPVDADTLARGAWREARLDWVTLTPGERMPVTGMHISRAGWTHSRSREYGKAGAVVVTCRCEARYVYGLAHRCEYVTRAGDERIRVSRTTRNRQSASERAHAEKRAAARAAGILAPVNVADAMARARASAALTHAGRDD